MRRSTSCLVAFPCAIGFACTAASAQTLVDNLGEVTRAATVFGGPTPDAIWAAQSFGTSFPCSLVSIDALMGFRSGDPVPVIELRSGATPDGALLGVLSPAFMQETSLDAVTLVPDTTIALSADEVYWIVVGMPDATSGSFQWAYAEGNNWIGPGYLANYSYSTDGVNWDLYGSDNPYQLRINITPACRADFNADGSLNSQDLFDFLTVFFAEDSGADFNFDAIVNSQDFFDYLAAFFTGC